MRKLLVIALLAGAGCSQGNPEETVSSPAPPPAAALAPLRGAASLERTLVLLERELAAAAADDNRADRLVRAEAITDRLLETQLPFAWLTARAYGVESLLRQIQSLADRILAQMRSGVHPGLIERDLVDLRAKVTDLRAGLRAGGGPMPLSLDTLLARYAADSLLEIVEIGGE